MNGDTLLPIVKRRPLVGSTIRLLGRLRLAQARATKWERHIPHSPLGPPGEKSLRLMRRGLPNNTPLDTLLLSLDSSPSTILPTNSPENPTSLQCTSPGGCNTQPPPATMAYQRADPRPFVPPNFHWVDLPKREFMCRAVATMRPPPTNEDLAIVSFDPLPGNVLNFGAVRNIVREFLIGRCINLRDILPCHLGQAYL